MAAMAASMEVEGRTKSKSDPSKCDVGGGVRYSYFPALFFSFQEGLVEILALESRDGHFSHVFENAFSKTLQTRICYRPYKS